MDAAHADGQVQLGKFRQLQLPHGAAQNLQLLVQHGTGQTLKQQKKFVAAVAHQCIAAPQQGAHRLGHAIQGGISGGVAEAVIDLLEVVHVNHSHSIFAAELPQLLVIVAPIKDLGGRVHVYLPVPHQQLVQQVLLLSAGATVQPDGIHALQ